MTSCEQTASLCNWILCCSADIVSAALSDASVGFKRRSFQTRRFKAWCAQQGGCRSLTWTSHLHSDCCSSQHPVQTIKGTVHPKVKLRYKVRWSLSAAGHLNNHEHWWRLWNSKMILKENNNLCVLGLLKLIFSLLLLAYVHIYLLQC